MSDRTDKKTEKEECTEEEKNDKKEEENEVDWDIWTDPLEELSEIEDAFEADEKDKLHGKTLLDVGTDCVKPLYLALKFELGLIVGINEDFSLYTFASDIQRKSKLFTETKVHFYSCSLFDDEQLNKILREEKIEKFDFVLVSKTLHHLRTGKCIASKRGSEHRCRTDEKCCVYQFKEQEVFDRLLRLGNMVIVAEAFYPPDKDEDKIRGRGGYFTTREWKRIFHHLLKKYKVEFFRPFRCSLDKKNFRKIITKLREVDIVCFHVETK